MKKQTKIIIGVVIALLLLANVAGYLTGKADQKAKDAEISRLATENQTFQTIHIGDNEIISRQEQRIVDLESAERANLIDLRALRAKGVKDIQAIVELKTEVARLKLEASYTKPPVIIHDTVLINGKPTVNDYLRVPLAWNFSDRWLKIDGVVKTTGVTIDSLFSYSEPSIILGWSTGFLKKSKPIIVFEDKNPHNMVKDMSNVVIYKKPPFFQRPWVNRVEGMLMILGAQWGINQMK